MEPDKNANFSHGLFEDTSNFGHKEKLHVMASAEDYIERLGGADEVNQAESYDAHLLALTEFRIARAEGVMYQNIEEYLENETPEKTLDRMVDRRQQLRKDLGLLNESPEAKKAESADAFFDVISGDE